MNKNNFAKQVYENFFTPTESEQEILQDKSYYRVLNMNNPFNDARTSYFFNSIGGYCAAKMRRYQDLIERHITPEMDSMVAASQKPGFSPEYLKNLKVLNMLNTKYIKYGDSKGQVIVNPYAMGNAWFVSSLKSVNGPDAEIETLNKIDPKIEAIVDVSKNAVSPEKYDTTGANIKLIETRANYQKYQSTNKNAGFAVFSEVFYREGWKAYLDGKEITPLRVDYILRGLNLPAGNHIVEFKFHPNSYYVGNNISLYSSIGLLLVIAGIFTIQLRKPNN